MRGMYYFDHDNNAHNDTKIIRLKRKFGYEGYGVYWLILEVLHANEGLLTNDILDDVAYQERIDDEWLENFIDYCVSIGLLRRDHDVIYSERMLTDIQAFKQLAEKRRAAAGNRWNRRTGDDQPDNRNIPQNNNTDADIAALAMEKFNKKFEAAMQAAEMQEQMQTVCNADNDNSGMQTECNSITSVNDLDMQNYLDDNANAMQTDEQTECKCNANAEQVQTVCNAKKRKENIINNNKQQQNITTCPGSIMLADEACVRQVTATLRELGIADDTSADILTKHTADYVAEKIALLQNTHNVQAPAAWLISAIEGDWRSPDEQSATPPVDTAANSKNALGGQDYDDFCAEYRRVFGTEYLDKNAYLQAVYISLTPSRVAMNIKYAEEIGADSFRKFVDDNNIKSFAELITSKVHVEKLAELYAAATSRESDEALKKYNALCHRKNEP